MGSTLLSHRFLPFLANHISTSSHRLSATPSASQCLRARAALSRANMEALSSTSTTPSPSGFEFDEEPFAFGLRQGYGYAKISINERLGPKNQFEILGKLGWGTYATTWLVRDHEKEQYSALKILTAYGTYLERGAIKGHPHLHEADIMRRVSRRTLSPGAQHCLRLIDSFSISRDTGNHLCLLTELTGLNLSMVQMAATTDLGFPSRLTKLFVKHICLALDYLHTECKVVHTDLKPSNILVGFEPKITEELISIYMEHTPLRKYPIRTVLGISEETIMSQALDVPGYDDVHPTKWILKLADFGSAQWLSKRSTDLVQPIQLRAPEVVLGREWNEKVDIWSLGCLTFEFLTGAVLYRAAQTTAWSEEEDLLATHLELHNIKRFPQSLIAEAKHASQYLNEDGTLKRIPEDMIYSKTMDRVLSTYMDVPINLDDPQRERDLALSFIERCVTLDAADRPTAAELLQHPWLQDVPGDDDDMERIVQRMHWAGEIQKLD